MAQKRPLKSVAIPQAERRTLVAQYARAGMTTREIAAEIGCGSTTVHRDRVALLGMLYEVATEDMGAWRSAKLESYRRKMEQLDAAIDGTYRVYLRNTDPDTDPDEVVDPPEKVASLVQAWVKIDERESRLIGADAPVRTQVEQVVQPMSAERAAEIIAEMGE